VPTLNASSTLSPRWALLRLSARPTQGCARRVRGAGRWDRGILGRDSRSGVRRGSYRQHCHCFDVAHSDEEPMAVLSIVPRSDPAPAIHIWSTLH